MSVAAFGDQHDPHDVSFESFIDADAIADHTDGDYDRQDPQPSSATSAPPASATMSSGASAMQHQHFSRHEDNVHHHHLSSISTSLPNTPKMASNYSFGSSGMAAHQHESSLNHLSFEWDDMNGHHHVEALSQQAIAATLPEASQPDLHGMPGLAYDSTSTPSDGSSWSSATGRRSLDEVGGRSGHHSFDGSSGAGFEQTSMHGRSVSLNLHGIIPASMTDDLLAQAPPPSRGQHPFIKMEQSDHMPFDDAHLQDLGHTNVLEEAASIAGQMALTTPFEKKRKLEQEGTNVKMEGSAALKGSAPTKKCGSKRKPSQSSNMSVNGTEDQSADFNSLLGADESVTQSVDGDGDDDGGNNATTRKPAAKGKKLPPSASQFTESGKPFPVIDTSAAHSSLFVPPDTSGLTKREARLVKNRAAAFLSRQRKREQFELLEKQCKSICRLTWKMWETIAGPNADVSALDQTVLPAIFADEAPDVRDCLEQIVNNKGASIAPTEESIANGTHSSRRDSSPPADHRASPCLANPRGAAATVGAKREREDESSNGNMKTEHLTIESLRSELAAAHKRETRLRTTLAEERNRWASAAPSAAATPSDLDAPANHSIPPFYPMHPSTSADGLDPSTFTAPSERVFRKGRSAGSGLSLTIAPQLTAADVDAAITPIPHRFPKSEGSLEERVARQPHTQEDKNARDISRGSSRPLSSAASQSLALTTTSSAGIPTSTRRATSGMALMVLLFGFALFGSGSLPSGSDMPRMGVTRLAPMHGTFSSVGNLFDPLSTSAGPDPLGFLHRRKEEEEEMDIGDGRPSSHLSASDLALHLPTSVAAQLDDVANLLPMCSLYDADEAPEVAKRMFINHFKSRPSQSHGRGDDEQYHLQNAFMLFGDEACEETLDNFKGNAYPSQDANSLTDRESIPRKLKLFLAQGRQSGDYNNKEKISLDHDAFASCSSRPCSTTSSPTAASSPRSSHSDDIFEDASVRTPISSRIELPAMPSERISVGKSRGGDEERDNILSFLELEFSLTGKRFVKDEEELASLIHRAAIQHMKAQAGCRGFRKQGGEEVDFDDNDHQTNLQQDEDRM